MGYSAPPKKPAEKTKKPRNLTEHPLLKKGDLQLDPSTLKPYTGPVFKMWKEKNVKKLEYPLIDGKPHGKYFSYHENGQKFGEVEFRDGKKQGKATLWHKNGAKEVCHYTNDKEDWCNVEVKPTVDCHKFSAKQLSKMNDAELEVIASDEMLTLMQRFPCTKELKVRKEATCPAIYKMMEDANRGNQRHEQFFALHFDNKFEWIKGCKKENNPAMRYCLWMKWKHADQYEPEGLGLGWIGPLSCFASPRNPHASYNSLEKYKEPKKNATCVDAYGRALRWWINTALFKTDTSSSVSFPRKRYRWIDNCENDRKLGKFTQKALDCYRNARNLDEAKAKCPYVPWYP